MSKSLDKFIQQFYDPTIQLPPEVMENLAEEMNVSVSILDKAIQAVMTDYTRVLERERLKHGREQKRLAPLIQMEKSKKEADAKQEADERAARFEHLKKREGESERHAEEMRAKIEDKRAKEAKQNRLEEKRRREAFDRQLLIDKKKEHDSKESQDKRAAANKASTTALMVRLADAIMNTDQLRELFKRRSNLTIDQQDQVRTALNEAVARLRDASALLSETKRRTKH